MGLAPWKWSVGEFSVFLGLAFRCLALRLQPASSRCYSSVYAGHVRRVYRFRGLDSLQTGSPWMILPPCLGSSPTSGRASTRRMHLAVVPILLVTQTSPDCQLERCRCCVGQCPGSESPLGVSASEMTATALRSTWLAHKLASSCWRGGRYLGRCGVFGGSLALNFPLLIDPIHRGPCMGH